MNILDNNITAINELCEKYKVKTLHTFGSVLTEKFNEESDIDLIVDFENQPVEDYVENYYDLKFSLENILQRSVDLLEEKAIKNPYFKQNIDQHKKLLYPLSFYSCVL